MTIQQISNELNFPSQTFFSKYFKTSNRIITQRISKELIPLVKLLFFKEMFFLT